MIMDTLKMNQIPLALSVILLVSGCATSRMQKTEDAYSDGTKQVNELLAAGTRTVPLNLAATQAGSVYLGSKVLPLKSEVILPRGLMAVKVFNFGERRFTLEQAATEISKMSGVSIRVSPDVYEVRKTNGLASPVDLTAPTTTGARPPIPTPLHVSPLPIQRDANVYVSLEGTMSSRDMLDKITRMRGLNWEHSDGAITIQKYVTRSFSLKVPPQATSFDYTAGKSGASQAQTASSGGTGQISTGFTATATITKKSGLISAMDSAEKAVKAVLTSEGRVVTSLSSGTIMVIDSPEGVARATKVIDRENEILTRKAVFNVQVLSFKENDGEENGIDWNLLLSNVGKLGASLTSPKTLVNDLGGKLDLNVVGTGGRFDGSRAIISMLRERGKVHTYYNANIQTRNRNVTPISALAQTVYIAQTTPAPAATGGGVGGVVGLTPGTVTTGFDMQLEPNILDSNQISLMFTLGVVDLLNIAKLTSGSGDNQQTIEGPETAGYQFQQDVFLMPGETALLSGYERTLSSFRNRTLGKYIPTAAGGSFKGDQSSEKIFILITPVVVGNAY
jgi:type IVB pilus formation R64 PilN family outer membrane protein